MDTTSHVVLNDDSLENNFDMGLGFALTEVLHQYIAEKKLPTDCILTISLKARIEEAHYDIEDLDAFY